MKIRFLLPAASLLLVSQTASAAPPEPRRPVELFLGLGFGNAVCDDKKPDTDCPVGSAGGTLSVGGAWRFHRRVAVGLELAAFSYKVRDSWRGQLTDPATDVKFSSTYLAPFLRWYFVSRGATEAYVQGGIGVGTVKGEATNAGGSYEANLSGVVVPLAIGAEWYVAPWFRLGPQLGAYLHRSTEACETTKGDKTCSQASRDQALLAWRFLLGATFTLG